jgi:hypothetical protein
MADNLGRREYHENSQPIALTAHPAEAVATDGLAPASKPMVIRELLEEALKEPSIGTTPRFRWHATSVGIAALWNKGQPPIAPPFDMALEEGLQVGLDLSREEREFHQVKSGLVLLFHS